MTSGELLSLVSDLIVVAAALVAGAFAFYRFRVSREAEAILELAIDPVVVRNAPDTLIDVVISVRNIGKAAAFVPRERLGDSRCCVRRVVPLPEGVISWDSLEGQDLFDPFAYMSEWFGHYPEEPMIIELGTTEIFHVFIVTRYLGVLWLRAAFVDKDENMWRGDRLLILEAVDAGDCTSRPNNPLQQTRPA